MFKGIIRKADIILLISLVILGVGSSYYIARSSTAGDKVVIELDGETYGSYRLTSDQTITVQNGEDYNVVVIKDGTAYVSKASCHNQVCVEHAPISATGESIICLPNKMIVSIEGKGERYDAISS